MGNYPPRGVRTKVNVEGLKEQRNIQTSPSKRGMGGYVGYPGVLMNPFPKHMSGDEYDATKKLAAEDNAKHKDAQKLVDDKCKYSSTTKGVGLFDSHPNVDAPTCMTLDPKCIVGSPTALETANPKERAQMIQATKPWEASGDKTWRHASPPPSWKYHSISKPAES